MARSLRLLVPTFPVNARDAIYFRGYMNISEKCEIVIYVTEFSTKNEEIMMERELNNGHTIYGYCTDNPKKNNKTHTRNCLILEKIESPKINKLIIDGKKIDPIENCLIMLYDHSRIKNSETLCDTKDYFLTLHYLMQNDAPIQDISYEPIWRSSYWLSSSMFAQHLLNYLNMVVWLSRTIRKSKKVSLKQGNLILAVLSDIILGYLVLELLLTHDKQELSATLMGVLEKLVNLLYSLLKWLMGAPAGLKLNNSFNKMLGRYFSYHIQLWWLFLDVTGEKLDVILYLFNYVGYLGITFQAAMISDMICVATFHSYCIYVYAARLFNIQISGLIALLRLFVGRKFNPLRGGIDSCEYTNQELFVGTVAFTILLLLLPTTAMYYIVFTLFRLLSLVVQYSLAKLIYLVQTLPLYVVTLWLVQSPKVAGNILLEMVNNREGSPSVLKVKLFNTSLGELVKKFKPPVEALKQFEWTNVLSNVFIGKQLI